MSKKFEEPPCTAVITTRFILWDNKPIHTVFHHEDDGMWEFLGADICNEDSDYVVISLEEMIAMDVSLLEIADLPMGSVASRTGPGLPWKIE